MSQKILIVIAVIFIVIGLIYYFGFYQKNEKQAEEIGGEKGQTEEEVDKIAEMPNPAALFCEEQGGNLKNVEFEKGTKGVCVFEDGSECGQWDFLNGDCGKGNLKKEILKEGTGKRADIGDVAIVHYTGTLEDGVKFDSSVDKEQPFSFKLGGGQVIKGWEQGVLGMRVGEKQKLTITHNLAYGEIGVPGVIPANATLIFEIELLGIE